VGLSASRRPAPPRSHGWLTAVLAVVSALLFVGGAVIGSIDWVTSAGSGSSTSPAAGSAADSRFQLAQSCEIQYVDPGAPCLSPGQLTQGIDCAAAFVGGLVEIAVYGPGCLGGSGAGQGSVGASAAVAAQNIVTTLNNYLNITNAAAANDNATFQELLSYYENRAEAIVPYFLNATAWNQTIYDLVAVDSGLVPSLEGVETAIAEQQYQDWNGSAGSWNAAFGTGAPYDGVTTYWLGGQGPALTAGVGFLKNGQDAVVGGPYEMQSVEPGRGGANGTFFNLEPGGTVLNANIYNASGSASFSNYTVYDLTQGTHFYVPLVSYDEWRAGTYPILSTIHDIGQFDLLKIVCNANCTSATFPAGTYETIGAYLFHNVTHPPLTTFGAYAYTSTGVPQLEIINTAVSNVGGAAIRTVPTNNLYDCISAGAFISDGCETSTFPTGGSSRTSSTGPGSVVAGNATLTQFPQTAQSLVNNTMTLAYDYWLTLRAVTQDGHYAIPAECSIPTPSDAFPAATNFVNYQLSGGNIEIVYLAYLNAVAREYGQVFTNQVGFCGDPNLGFAFNWTSAWHLTLNVTASFYLYGNVNGTGGPLNLNGTAATGTTYADVASWPAYQVDPALVYPYEYTQFVPLNTRFPIPVNNPMVAVLVDYPGNLEYGNPFFSPTWGVPTYLSLTGTGNYTDVNGTPSDTATGAPPQDGDAIVISSCVLNGIPQNPCEISDTYFASFAFGIVHSIIPPPYPTPGTGGLGALGNNCGFSALNQWYDGWAGYIGSAVGNAFYYLGSAANGIPIIGGGLSFIINGIGCILAWALVILIFAVFVYIAAWVAIGIYRSFRGRRRAPSGNVS
jgi:hypothetical protein